MPRVAALACLLALTGCAAGTDAALTAQDAKSKLGVKDRAVEQLARTELTAITTQAQAWAVAQGGVMTGFAANLRDTQPSVASTAVNLTDTSASVRVAGAQCLTSALPSGAPVLTAC